MSVAPNPQFEGNHFDWAGVKYYLPLKCGRIRQVAAVSLDREMLVCIECDNCVCWLLENGKLMLGAY